MTDLAIRVERLSKKYQIKSARAGYATLREELIETAIKLLRSGSSVDETVSLLALNDVSFEIRQGEVVGIIGRNGAGKSTLLKILSRITRPSGGRATIYGRVGSLLEVGTGFHPELTGRENIFLSGSVLGMRRKEILRKFDAIVDFAEVEDFVEVPVKRYSSGMHMRLAFAVAAHLEPEILLVDEVLAVGDAEFQKKSFRKMRSIGQSGRTILFVSHNMAAVRTICQRGILLDDGRVVADGDVNTVADEYLAKSLNRRSLAHDIETPAFLLHNVWIETLDSSPVKTFSSANIMVEFTPKVDILDPGVYVGLLTLEGHRLAGLDYKDFATCGKISAGQRGRLGFAVDGLPLLPGEYQMEVHLKDMASHQIDIVATTFEFEVVEVPVYGGRKLDHWFGDIGLRAKALNFEMVEGES